LVISSENEVDLCFEAKKMCDNDGPPYNCPGQLIAVVAKKKRKILAKFPFKTAPGVQNTGKFSKKP